MENGQRVAAAGMAYSNYMGRAFELEREAMEARSSFERHRAELQSPLDQLGPEQGDGEGLL